MGDARGRAARGGEEPPTRVVGALERRFGAVDAGSRRGEGEGHAGEHASSAAGRDDGVEVSGPAITILRWRRLIVCEGRGSGRGPISVLPMDYCYLAS